MNNLDQPRNTTPRIGLFGGTFNPIHRGHQRAADDVLRQFCLDQIYFIPSAVPPHKTHGILAPAKDRYKMVRLAVRDQNAVTVSEIESLRSGPSYTIDTLKSFTTYVAENATLYFIVGIDAFLEIHTWKSYRKLFDRAAFILMTRPRPDGKALPLHPHAIDYVRQHISDKYTLAIDGHALVHPKMKTIFLAEVKPIAIASSQIRDMVRHGEPIHQWVSPAVSDYIAIKGLYR